MLIMFYSYYYLSVLIIPIYNLLHSTIFIPHCDHTTFTAFIRSTSYDCPNNFSESNGIIKATEYV